VSKIKQQVKSVIVKTVKALKLEDLMYRIGYRNLIPHHTLYNKASFRDATRNGVNYCLDMSDSMQWYVFAGIDDSFHDRVIKGKIRANTTVIDIGCNIGEFSLQVCKECEDNALDVTLISIDPNPYIIELFENNLKLNTFSRASIVIKKIAISNTNNQAVFSFDDRKSGGGRLDSSHENKLSVDVVRLDDLVKTEQIDRIGYVKIDVEGFDGHVLDGAKETIRQFRPICYIEVTPKWLERNGFSASYIYDYFQALSYVIYVDSGKKLSAFDSGNSILSKQHNILCLPEKL
jgi:FkbM family methyltransferase